MVRTLLRSGISHKTLPRAKLLGPPAPDRLLVRAVPATSRKAPTAAVVEVVEDEVLCTRQ
jgi:hypothetical protein